MAGVLGHGVMCGALVHQGVAGLVCGLLDSFTDLGLLDGKLSIEREGY